MMCATIGLAAAGDMAGADIKKAVSGKTVHVTTSMGSLPITYHSNGTMKSNSNSIARLTGVGKDKGRWWISGHKLCQKWKTWLKGEAHCVSVQRKGDKLMWTGTGGRSGTARISSN